MSQVSPAQLARIATAPLLPATPFLFRRRTRDQALDLRQVARQALAEPLSALQALFEDYGQALACQRVELVGYDNGSRK
jgi:predicted esterase